MREKLFASLIQTVQWLLCCHPATYLNILRCEMPELLIGKQGKRRGSHRGQNIIRFTPSKRAICTSFALCPLKHRWTSTELNGGSQKDHCQSHCFVPLLVCLRLPDVPGKILTRRQFPATFPVLAGFGTGVWQFLSFALCHFISRPPPPFPSSSSISYVS